MLSVAEFFAESHRGNHFGVKGPLYGPGGHRGDDTNGWGLGTGIPSFVNGVVVFSGKYVSLGWTTTVRTVLDGRTAWVSFCHEYSAGPSVGTPIRVGSWVGPLGNSGTLSLGKHVHVVVSFTSSDPRTGSVVDPRPYINRAKTSAAGGSATLISLPKGNDMTFMYTPKNRTGAADSPHAFVLAWLDLPNGKLYEFDSENPNDLNIAYGIFGMHGVNYVPGGFGGSWNPVDAPGKVSAAQYDAIRRLWNSQMPATGTVGSTAAASKADVDAAADRVIAQVPPAVIVEQKKPGN